METSVRFKEGRRVMRGPVGQDLLIALVKAKAGESVQEVLTRTLEGEYLSQPLRLEIHQTLSLMAHKKVFELSESDRRELHITIEKRNAEVIRRTLAGEFSGAQWCENLRAAVKRKRAKEGFHLAITNPEVIREICLAGLRLREAQL